MLVLVASLGWGVTRPYLDQPTILKARGVVGLSQVPAEPKGLDLHLHQVQGLSFLYIVLDFVRESALSFRTWVPEHSDAL